MISNSNLELCSLTDWDYSLHRCRYDIVKNPDVIMSDTPKSDRGDEVDDEDDEEEDGQDFNSADDDEDDDEDDDDDGDDDDEEDEDEDEEELSKLLNKRKAEENSSGSSSSSKKTKTVENDEEEDEDDDEPKLVPEALDCIDSSNIIARVPRRSALASGLGTKSTSSHVTPARKSVAKDDDDEEAEF